MRLRSRNAWIGLIFLVSFPASAQETPSTQPAASPLEIPKFHAESRQVVVEAEVWKPVDKKNAGDLSWVPEDAVAGANLRNLLELMPPAAKGLTAGDFHVFDNGVEQRLNYFKEADFPTVAITEGFWRFDPTAHGIWGTLSCCSGVDRVPSATYLIGYVPPALQPGECRTIQIVVPNHYVQASRTQYCTAEKADTAATVEDAKLAARMERFASSSKPGAMNVSVGAAAFWSSGVLSPAKQTPLTGNATASAPALPATDFTYIVEVHDSKASATVQITTEFGFPYQFPMWDYPCQKSSAIHVLGMAYNTNGELERQFGDTFRCDMRGEIPGGGTFQKIPGVKAAIPTLFDTQVELRPGEYELRVVVSDGKKFGRARVSLRVGPLNGNGLTVSDVALNSILRDASWVVRDAAKFTPAPIVPTPLVSKNVQFLLVPDAEIHKNNLLSVYFEIYEPPLETADTAIYYRIRITDLKTGTTVMNTEPISAADFVAHGSGVVPVGLKVDINKLGPSSYRLEVQASDSAGRESEWREAKFTIQ